MDLGSLLLGLALFLLVAFIVARPLIEKRGLREKELGPADRLIARRDIILNALRDLDFDHATGKIADDDYAPQRAQLVAQGVAVLKQLDELGAVGERLQPGADRIEQAVAARRRARRDGEGESDDPIEAAIAARRRSASAPVSASGAVGAPLQGVTCPHCGAAAQAGDRFCSRCGQSLSLTCAACGTPAHPDDRFCARCGAKLQRAEVAR
jgi:hypothetical protein